MAFNNPGQTKKTIVFSVSVLMRMTIFHGTDRIPTTVQVTVPIPPMLCPSCKQATCVKQCHGSRGRDANNKETKAQTIARQRYNAVCKLITDVVAGHTAQGVSTHDEDYLRPFQLALRKARADYEEAAGVMTSKEQLASLVKLAEVDVEQGRLIDHEDVRDELLGGEG